MSSCFASRRSMSLSRAYTLNCSTFFVSFSCSTSFRYCHSRIMWSHKACIILCAQSYDFSLILSFCMCCFTYSIHCLPKRPLIKLYHPIVSCSLNASFRWFRMLSYVGGKDVVISHPFGAHVYPCNPFYMAVQTIIWKLPVCHRLLRLFHDSSLFIHSSMNGYVNMCIQYSSGALQIQQDFFPP
jgi:hypothetical protein